MDGVTERKYKPDLEKGLIVDSTARDLGVVAGQKERERRPKKAQSDLGEMLRWLKQEGNLNSLVNGVRDKYGAEMTALVAKARTGQNITLDFIENWRDTIQNKPANVCLRVENRSNPRSVSASVYLEPERLAVDREGRRPAMADRGARITFAFNPDNLSCEDLHVGNRTIISLGRLKTAKEQALQDKPLPRSPEKTLEEKIRQSIPELNIPFARGAAFEVLNNLAGETAESLGAK